MPDNCLGSQTVHDAQGALRAPGALGPAAALAPAPSLAALGAAGLAAGLPATWSSLSCSALLSTVWPVAGCELCELQG